SKYSPELRERAVRMVFDHAHEHPSQWATIRSVAEKLGCTVEALRRWVRQAERDAGKRPGLTTNEREELKRLQRENFKLKRAGERRSSGSATRSSSATRLPFAPRRGQTAERNNGGLHRPPPGPLRSRADLCGPAHRSVDVLPAEGAAAGSGATIGPGPARQGAPARDSVRVERAPAGLRAAEGVAAIAARRRPRRAVHRRAPDARAGPARGGAGSRLEDH